jgi:hypothetical protein
MLALVVCPKCVIQSAQELDERRVVHELSCPKCDTQFTTNLCRIRASWSKSASIGRDYNVRVITATGEEDLITFMTLFLEPIELRSQDAAGFSYLGNRLMIIQNFTINRFWRVGWNIRKPSPVLTSALVVLVIIALVFMLYVMRATGVLP